MKNIIPNCMVLLSFLGSSSANIQEASCYYNTKLFVYSEYTDTCRVLWDKEMIELEYMR